MGVDDTRPELQRLADQRVSRHRLRLQAKPPARTAHWRRFAKLRGPREIAGVIALTLVYFLTRGLVRGRESDAFHHAYLLLRVEDILRLNGERALQQVALDNGWLLALVNNYYFYGHLPVLIAVGLWLYWFRPLAYPWFRNAFVLSALFGLSIYIWLPMAPPRFLPGFVDTMKVYGFNVDGSGAGPFYNPYAAMPSLHTGWSVLAGVAVFTCTTRWWGKVLGAALPALMVLSVIMTGNHFTLDAIVGAALTALALNLSARWTKEPTHATNHQERHIATRLRA